MIIRVDRVGTVTCSDYYDVDEITPETIEKCINDDSELFVETEYLYETWEPTGEYEVINNKTGEIIKDSNDRSI